MNEQISATGGDLAALLKSLADVLVTIKTPLVLVAFFIAAIVAITWIVEKQRGRDRTRVAIWGMAIAGSLVLVSTAGYMYQQRATDADINAYGTVRGVDGVQLPGVMVSISGGIPAQITNLYGQFNFVIPKSFQSPTYTIRANAEGYDSYEKTLTQPEIREMSLVLKPGSGESFSVALGGRIVVSHFLGEPIAGFGLKLTNKSRRPMELSDLGLTLESSQGDSRSLLLGATATTDRGAYNFPAFNWRIQPGESFDNYLWWSPVPWEVLGSALTLELKRLPEYADPVKWPCMSEGLSVSAEKIVRDSFASAFVWSAGKWKFVLHGRVDGKRFEKKWDVALTANDIEGMRAVADSYGQCVAVNVGSFLISNGKTRTFVHKDIPDL